MPDDIPGSDQFLHLVGHLDTHGVFVGNGRNTNAHGTQRQRNIIGQIDHLGKLDAPLEQQLIPGDRGSVGGVDDGGLHAKGLEGIHQPLGAPLDGLGRAGRLSGTGLQQADGGI